jgi:ribosomal protein S18 acetylase RimI-like enzyme
LNDILEGAINMSEIIIRDATETDLQAIGNLLSELIDRIEDQENIDLDNALINLKSLLHERNSYTIAAESDNEIIGFINFTTRQSVLHSGPSGLIDELVVSEKYRTEGVGKKLVESAVNMCRSLGCVELEVSTETQNQTAQNFYEHLGFKERGLIFELDLD